MQELQLEPGLQLLADKTTAPVFVIGGPEELHGTVTLGILKLVAGTEPGQTSLGLEQVQVRRQGGQQVPVSQAYSLPLHISE